MPNRIQKVVVLGGGSAGLLAALALKRAFPRLEATLVRSPSIPAIGVGESTTALFPPFLHTSLGLDEKEFFEAVRPSWKLGIRFEWGDPADSHFNYPFDQCMSRQVPTLGRTPAYYAMGDLRDAGLFSAMMDRDKSPCLPTADGHYRVDDGAGYHIENAAFLKYLEAVAPRFGVKLESGELAQVHRLASGEVESLELADGRRLAGDLFIDASGFSSLLLGDALAEPYTSYASSLFCDRAIVGHWRREHAVLPYTTAETMDHGWCWRIEFPDMVSRGYVYASAHCSDDEAMKEMKRKNPELGDDLRQVKFRSGRLDNFFVGNVAAVGNASGFVEPLEASALHVLIEQIRLLCRTLAEGDLRILPAIQAASNRRFRLLWDEVRDFLAIHYKFNRRLDTPFWRHARAETDLAGAAELVEMYQQAGPSTLSGGLLPSGVIFGYDGFMTLLVGQRVETAYQPDIGEDEMRAWNAHRDRVRAHAEAALSMEDGLRLVYHPDWRWPNRLGRGAG